jgi:hypothetical protein
MRNNEVVKTFCPRCGNDKATLTKKDNFFILNCDKCNFNMGTPINVIGEVKADSELGEVFELAKYSSGLSQKDALKLAESKGLRLITNKEADLILMDDNLRKKYNDYLPLWTSTKVEMKGMACKISEPGRKSIFRNIPPVDGWYEQDTFGLPFGKASSGDNLDARYLWRINEYSGLVARGGDFNYVRRSVDACCVGRLGVLAVKKICKKVKL